MTGQLELAVTAHTDLARHIHDLAHQMVSRAEANAFGEPGPGNVYDSALSVEDWHTYIGVERAQELQTAAQNLLVRTVLTEVRLLTEALRYGARQKGWTDD